MSYIHVDSKRLIRLVNNLVGIEYKIHIRNYYSELQRQIRESSYLPEKIKRKNFARITRNFRDAIDFNKSQIPISVELLHALYCLYLEKPQPLNKTPLELWGDIENKYIEAEGLEDPFTGTKWSMYFLDNDNRSNTEFNLFKGFLSFTTSQCKLEYRRKMGTNLIRLYGTRSFITSNNNVLKVKLWSNSKHINTKEPYVILQFVVDNIKLHQLVEGLYLLYEGDNILYSGTVLLDQHHLGNEYSLDYIDLHKDDVVSRFDINRRAIVQYFSGRYKNVIQTFNGVLGNFSDLSNWNKNRDQKLYRKNIDLFISTPISVLKTREQFIAVRMLTILLKIVLKNALGINNIFCSIVDKNVLLDQNRYSRRQTLNKASENFRRSQRYLFFNPVNIKSSSVSGAYLELGWALFDRKIIPSYVMSASNDQLPKYVRDLKTDNEKFGVSTSMNEFNLNPVEVNKNSLKLFFDYFLSKDLISNLCEASIYYNIYGVLESDITKELTRMQSDNTTINKLESALADSISIFNELPKSIERIENM